MEIKETKQKFIILSEEERDALNKVTDILQEFSWELHSSKSTIEVDDGTFDKDDIRCLFFNLCSFLDSGEIKLTEKDA